MSTSISTTLAACLESFNKLKALVEQLDYGREEEVPSAAWTDELGRLRVWASNVGAHQTGQSSLESRMIGPPTLFDSQAKICQQFAKLLADLKLILTETRNELSGLGSSASGDDAPPEALPDQTTELQQSHESVVSTIDCLNQLAEIIRKPSRATLDDRSEGSLAEGNENSPSTPPTEGTDSHSANPVEHRANHGQGGKVPGPGA